MKFTFVSNYLNHHQIPFCDKMQDLCEGDFHFIAIEPMANERMAMGWQVDRQYVYEVKYWQSSSEKRLGERLIAESDVVVFGGGSYAPLIADRIKKNKLTFLYSERIYRRGLWRVFSPRGQYYLRRDNTQYMKNKLYLLSAGAYVPMDFAMVQAYKHKSYKWGYFPQTYHYDLDELFAKKTGKIEILWVSRFIPLKHPEKVLNLAKHLKKDGYEFHINMIGIGEMREEIDAQIQDIYLEKYISLLGSMKPHEVRQYMEEANIFLFTSDYQEGWGAVLNESMNSGCAVVASHAIGATPYLIKHGVNGLIYKDESQDDLYRQVKSLMDDRAMAKRLGANAYFTIIKTWNAENAARNLVKLAEALLNDQKTPIVEGPGSIAPLIWQWNMYSRIMKGRV